MLGDIDQWVKMLTGVVGGAAENDIAVLEGSCRALEAQIAGLDSDRNPRDRLTQLEASVSELSAKSQILEEECAALDKEIRDLLEQRQSAVLARLEAARRQDVLSDAIEATERASQFFNAEFLSMSEAKVEKLRPQISRQLKATRKKLGALVVAAQKALEQHEPVLADAKRHESEQAQLRVEIASLEQQLGKVHHVEPALLRRLGEFSRDQLEAYHGEVILERLSDARLENARELKEDVWSKVAG